MELVQLPNISLFKKEILGSGNEDNNAMYHYLLLDNNAIVSL